MSDSVALLNGLGSPPPPPPTSPFAPTLYPSPLPSSTPPLPPPYTLHLPTPSVSASSPTPPAFLHLLTLLELMPRHPGRLQCTGRATKKPEYSSLCLHFFRSTLIGLPYCIVNKTIYVCRCTLTTCIWNGESQLASLSIRNSKANYYIQLIWLKSPKVKVYFAWDGFLWRTAI